MDYKLWIILGGYLCLCQAHLDLYINETETRRLLGIPGELYYVRNGIINSYALSFNMPIKPDIAAIYFNWQSLKKSPPMVYNMGFTVSNTDALHHPSPSIPREGVVPTTPTVFAISFLCTGKMSTEVDIRLQLNVSIFTASNATTLEIKRRKTCLKTAAEEDLDFGPQYQHPQVKDKDPAANATYVVFPFNARESVMTSTNIFYVAVGSACAVILLIALIVALVYLRGPKLTDAGGAPGGGHQYIRPDTPNNSLVNGGGAGKYSALLSSSVVSTHRSASPAPPPPAELSHHDVRHILAELQVPHSRLLNNTLLMEGTFGKVYCGTLLGEGGEDDRAVFIKTVTEKVARTAVNRFLRDACFLAGITHQNLLSVAACCLDDVWQPAIVYHFSNEGNLKKFLQRCKISDLASQQGLTTQQLVYMAIQVLRAVQFLHRKSIVHRDLATRNCVVDSQLTVRVTDTALARDLFPNDYHCLGDNENRPVKWLSLEALLDRRFPPAADVWAFGVLLWELMTLGQQPYDEVDPFEMAAYLKESYRLAQPLNCPDELFAVMACCWSLNPDERPKMSQLLVCIQDFYTALGRFI